MQDDTLRAVRRSIYRGSRLVRGTKTVLLDSVSWCFSCPGTLPSDVRCEYGMTGLTCEDVQTLRRQHFLKCHPELVIDARMAESPLFVEL